MSDDMLLQAIEKQRGKSKEEPETVDLLNLDDELRVRTHVELDPNLVGRVDHLNEDESHTTLNTTKAMHADEERLVHSGFIGSSAEYAALIAVNEPNAMIYSVSSQYFSCARVGEDVTFKATVQHTEGHKRNVTVIGSIESIKVYRANIIVIIPEYHPLKIKLLEIAGAV